MDEAAIRNAYNTYGFVIFNDVFTEEEIEKIRMPIKTYFRKGYNCSNGISIPDFMSKPEFESIWYLKNDERIRKLLKIIFNGDNFRFCSHNDIGINRVVDWHKDKLNNEYAKYQQHDIWKKVGDEKHEIVKVAIYLQDHQKDNFALKVIPGSHLEKVIRIGKKHLQLKPKLGDIIIFDQRITHRGQDRKTNDDRILVSLGFGKNNIFTDEFERGTIARQRKQSGSCRFDKVLEKTI